MQTKKTIKQITLILVFLFSFVFQTGYSLSIKLPASDAKNVCQKPLEKKAEGEDSQNNFIEEEENDDESNNETICFTLPVVIFHFNYFSKDVQSVKEHNLPSLRNDIFISTHNLRI